MYKYVLILLVCFSTLSLAKESTLKKGLLERMVQPKISLNSAYISDANVEGSEGSVSVVKNSLRINNAIGGITYTNWSFLWNNIADLPFGNGVDKPIEQMHRIAVRVTFPYFINEKWFLLTSLSLNSTFEREMDDSYGGGFFTFASYKLNENHTFQIGAFGNYHPVSTLALPVMSYSYRARQTDGLQVILGFPRAYVGYFINDALQLRSGMIFSQSVIKLADESVVESSGYIEAEDYMGNLGINYELNPKFTLTTDLLYSLKRDFTIYNSAGKKQNSYAIEPSFGVNLRLKYIF